MNNEERLERAKALKSSDDKTFDSLITAMNGGSGSGFKVGDLVSFADKYEKNKNLFLSKVNNFDNILLFVTLGENYDQNNVTEVYSTLFVRRFGITDVSGNKHFPKIDGKIYTGMLISFLKEFGGKTLKCTDVEEFETESFGTRRVYHWETVTNNSQSEQA